MKKKKRKAKKKMITAKYVWEDRKNPGWSEELHAAKDKLPNIEEFDGLRSLVAFLQTFNKDELGKLINFLRMNSTRDFVLDLDKEAKFSGLQRTEDLDYGFIKNFAVYKIIYEYTKNLPANDLGDFDKNKTISNAIKWMDYLVYGGDTRIYDKFGNSIINDNSMAPPESKKPPRPGIKFPGTEVKPKKEKKPKDELGLRLDSCSGDFDKLVAVAEEYGLSKDDCMKYHHFVENGKKGLLRMSIENRIRGLLRKQED